MRIGSLFSGIGGLELGLERAGLGRTIWQVESDARCREVLAKHWPNAERHADVRDVPSWYLVPVDLICGGFPCQDVSSAGKRVGLDGARSGLWWEYLRIVSELLPSWVVVENVASGARAWVDVVVNGLEQRGYACLPVPLAAADVGAPHERERIFIVAAHAHAKSQHTGAFDAEVAGASAAAHTNQARQQGSGPDAHEGGPRPTERGWRTPMPDMVRVVHGISDRLDRPRPRIEALGNSVVPQCSEVIGHVIRQLAGP